MGEWLFKDDEYKPEEDKDKFIDKSIFSILKVISKIKREDTKVKNKGFYELNPVLKLLLTILLIVFISLSRRAAYVGLACTSTSISLLLLNKQDGKRGFLGGVIFAVFTAIMLLPSMLIGNFNNSLLMTIKVFTTISLANVLAYSTKWIELSRSLKLLLVPDIFILVLELTLRYIYILGEAGMELLLALKLRSVGRNDRKYNSLSVVAGNLFLKSKDMGEELYSAMECRGFTGEYNSVLNLRFRLIDTLYIAYNVILIAAYFLLNN